MSVLLTCLSDSLQITKPFFSALGDEKVQQKLLSVMFDLLVESRSPLVANTVSSVFKGVSRERETDLFSLKQAERLEAGHECVFLLAGGCRRSAGGQ